MLKTVQGTKPFLPAIAHWDIARHLGALAPDERQLLRFIAEHGDLTPIKDPDFCAVVTIPLTPAMLDVLAAFEADAADMEREEDDEVETDTGADDDGEGEDVDKEPDADSEAWDQPLGAVSWVPPVLAERDPTPLTAEDEAFNRKFDKGKEICRAYLERENREAESRMVWATEMAPLASTIPQGRDA